MIPKSIKLRDCIVQLNTGLNPRDNFSLGEGSIKYITAKNLNKAGYFLLFMTLLIKTVFSVFIASLNILAKFFLKQALKFSLS